MFRLEPVAALKFKVVTVLEPALKAPVKAIVVPVAFVKLKVVTVEDPALKAPVSAKLAPVALLNVTVFNEERPEIVADPDASDPDETTPDAKSDPFVYTLEALPMEPSTYRSFPENWNALFEIEEVAAPIVTSLFWLRPMMRRLEEAETPSSWKKYGALVVAVPPITMSLVEVLLRTTSVARLYAQLMSEVAPAGQLVPVVRQTVEPPTRRLVTEREVPVAPTKVSAPVRFADEPVVLLKFKLVTVDEPAEKSPVSNRLEPVALVQIMRFTVVSCEMFRLVPVPAPKVNGPVRFKAEPVALLKFKVVTVLEPALKAPVRFKLEPEAEVYETRFSVES